MIDIESAKKEFINYTSNYNLEDYNIKRKFDHSFRVMKLSEHIAESLNLDNEKVEVASIIGLLHDIARFEQWKQYHTYRDLDSFDHGDYGVKILKKDDFIRKFIYENKYDDIIFKAIKNHNKFEIEKGLNEEYLRFAKIIRDADKIDILYQGVSIFWENDVDKNNIENLILSDHTYKQIVQNSQVKRMNDDNALDKLVIMIGFTFDINFKYSFRTLKRRGYINQILNKFNFKNEDTRVKINEIRDIANKYVENKC